jgi:DNA polymerase-3 subunit beta
LKVNSSLEAFRTAFQLAAGACPSRSPKPILMDILMRADEGGVTLIGSDLEIGLSIAVAGATVEEPGAALLRGQLCRAALEKASGDRIAVEGDAASVGLACGMSEHEFPGGNPAEFPVPPGFGDGPYHVVRAADMKRLIQRTVHATGTGSGQYAHAGVLVEREPGRIRFVALDGGRAALQVVDSETVGEPGWTGQVVVQRKALDLLDRHLSDEDPPVHMAFTANAATFRTGSAVLWGRQVEGRFLPWRNAAWDGPTRRVTVKAGELRRAVEQAAIVTDEITRSVWFRFGGATLRLDSAAETGKSRSAVAVQMTGDPIDLRFNPALIVPTLKALGGDADVAIEVKSDRNVAMFRTDDDFTLMVVPIVQPASRRDDD